MKKKSIWNTQVNSSQQKLSKSFNTYKNEIPIDTLLRMTHDSTHDMAQSPIMYFFPQRKYLLVPLLQLNSAGEFLEKTSGHLEFFP